MRPDSLVPPNEFIPVADETGLILPINHLVLRDACHQLRAWQLRFPSQALLTMSVNIAPKQFSQPDLAKDVRCAIQETGLSPEALQLEIMETTTMEAEKAAQILAELKVSGFA
jgi:EAL domain-containing protein (putative c-di-GMP-specific phosphodiesterase class I)